MSLAPKILILATGGTIASSKTNAGLAPLANAQNLEQAEWFLLLRRHFPEITFDIEQIFNLDSSNIQSEHWQILARRIFAKISNYTGILITHGTDTLAYTSAALYYMLANLNKPVVLTGSQRPLTAPYSDALYNLESAVEVICHNLIGITIVFNGLVINAPYLAKISSQDIEAFASINAPLRAKIKASGLEILDSDQEEILQKQHLEQKPFLLDKFCKDIALIKVFPEMNLDILELLPKIGIKGLILESYGIGGVDYKLSAKIKELCQAGIKVIVTSQCRVGGVDLNIYEVGQKLLEAGAIPAHKLTSEASFVKLGWALANQQEIASF